MEWFFGTVVVAGGCAILWFGIIKPKFGKKLGL